MWWRRRLCSGSNVVVTLIIILTLFIIVSLLLSPTHAFTTTTTITTISTGRAIVQQQRIRRSIGTVSQSRLTLPHMGLNHESETNEDEHIVSLLLPPIDETTTTANRGGSNGDETLRTVDAATTAATTTTTKETLHNDDIDTLHDVTASSSSSPSLITQVLDSYWGSRLILLMCAAIYSTNFALGTLMNETLPPSAVTACRMTFAALTLLPFLLQIQMTLLPRAILTGMCAALGYVTQSMALSDTDPARVSFLGAATVLWLPILESTIDRVPMSITDAPQTWMAALLCMMGVGILELYDPSGGATAMTSGIHTGDILALIQAIGFGTGAYLSSKLVREQPDQVLSITSVLIATTAILSWIWCILVGSTSSLMTLLQSDPIHTNLPLVFSILWTGIISTSINYVIEIAALGRVPPAEASVLLASEPIWAAVFATVVISNTSLGANDYIGGSCIVAACLVNALLKPQDILNIFSMNNDQKKN